MCNRHLDLGIYKSEEVSEEKNKQGFRKFVHLNHLNLIGIIRILPQMCKTYKPFTCLWKAPEDKSSAQP